MPVNIPARSFAGHAVCLCVRHQSFIACGLKRSALSSAVVFPIRAVVHTVDLQAALSRGEAVQDDAGELVDGDDGLHDYAGSGALTHLTIQA